MFFISLFCVIAISYILYTRMDTKPSETAIEFAFLTLMSIVGSYVFGATWHDINQMKADNAEDKS